MNTSKILAIASVVILSSACKPPELTFYFDSDGDGYGDPTISVTPEDRIAPTGYVADFKDCDDTTSLINPMMPEILDGIDNNCDGITDSYSVGNTGPAGGIVFHIDETGDHGLEAARVDQGIGVATLWGCSDIEINGADDTEVGTGKQNTADILAECSEEGIAAKLADDYNYGGYDDWFLPSKGELIAMYFARHDLGGFPGTGLDYWSSSESSPTHAWSQNFQTASKYRPFYGRQQEISKAADRRVRSIRAF